MTTCANCQTRPASKPAKLFADQEENHFCPICRQAHRIFHTSIGDARQSIANETEPEIIVRALSMELSRKLSARSSLVTLLTRRLKNLSKTP